MGFGIAPSTGAQVGPGGAAEDPYPGLPLCRPARRETLLRPEDAPVWLCPCWAPLGAEARGGCDPPRPRRRRPRGGAAVMLCKRLRGLGGKGDPAPSPARHPGIPRTRVPQDSRQAVTRRPHTCLEPGETAQSFVHLGARLLAAGAPCSPPSPGRERMRRPGRTSRAWGKGRRFPGAAGDGEPKVCLGSAGDWGVSGKGEAQREGKGFEGVGI